MRALLYFQVYKMVEGAFASTKLIREPLAIKTKVDRPPAKRSKFRSKAGGNSNSLLDQGGVHHGHVVSGPHTQ